jgi:hypothetical protein
LVAKTALFLHHIYMQTNANQAARSAAARRAWETIRARKAAGFYAQPHEQRAVPVAPIPDFVRCEVRERFQMARTDCRWQNARFQGQAGGAPDLVRRLADVPPAVAGAEPINNVDRRDLQASMFKPGQQWFAGPVR